MAQILKLFHGFIRPGEGIRNIQHVIPKELVQAGQRLRGLGAVEKELALHILDSEAFAKAIRKRGVGRRKGRAGALIQRPDLAGIQAAGEQGAELVDVLIARHQPIQLLDLSYGVLTAVEAKDGDKGVLLSLAIVVSQRHHGVGCALAQVFRGNLTGLRIFLLPPRAAHIGHEVAAVVPSQILLRGSIELHLVLRYEHCGHGIQQRGFS